MGNILSGSREKHNTVSKPRPRQNYNPIQYTVDATTIHNPTLVVNQVHFVAETLLKSGGNHWVIDLQTGTDKAIRINMEPSNILGAPRPGHGYRGQMVIGNINENDMTRRREGLITVSAKPDHAVADFVDAIIQVGNHEYDFTTEGRGCTGWVADQFCLFRELEFIELGGEDVGMAVNQEWVDGWPRSVRPAARGFYMRDTRDGGWSGGRG